jgi:hypothetical protein
VGPGNDPGPGYSDVYSGGRNILADLNELAEISGCAPHAKLSDGRLVLAVDRTPAIKVDRAAA